MNVEQIKSQALQRLRDAAGRPDVEFQVIVTTRPVPNKELVIALVFACALLAWYIPQALGIDLTLDIPNRRLRHAPTALLAAALAMPLFLTRTWSLGFCKDGSVVVARNGWTRSVDVVQTVHRPEILVEQEPPMWRPPRIGVNEWVWQVNYNDSAEEVPRWVDRNRSRGVIDLRDPAPHQTF